MVSVEVQVDVVHPRWRVVDGGGEGGTAQFEGVGPVVVTDVPGDVQIVAAPLQLKPFGNPSK